MFKTVLRFVKFAGKFTVSKAKRAVCVIKREKYPKILDLKPCMDAKVRYVPVRLKAFSPLSWIAFVTRRKSCVSTRSVPLMVTYKYDETSDSRKAIVYSPIPVTKRDVFTKVFLKSHPLELGNAPVFVSACLVALRNGTPHVRNCRHVLSMFRSVSLGYTCRMIDVCDLMCSKTERKLITSLLIGKKQNSTSLQYALILKWISMGKFVDLTLTNKLQSVQEALDQCIEEGRCAD